MCVITVEEEIHRSTEKNARNNSPKYSQPTDFDKRAKSKSKRKDFFSTKDVRLAVHS